MTEKEIKQEIRRLRKCKKDCRAGTEERLSLHRKITELKRQIDTLYVIEPEKEKIINEILKLEPNIEDFIDIRKHSVEALNIHLNRLKEKVK